MSRLAAKFAVLAAIAALDIGKSAGLDKVADEFYTDFIGRGGQIRDQGAGRLGQREGVLVGDGDAL